MYYVQDARGAGTDVRVDINGEEFNTSGLMVIEKNYLEVYCTVLVPFDFTSECFQGL